MPGNITHILLWFSRSEGSKGSGDTFPKPILSNFDARKSRVGQSAATPELTGMTKKGLKGLAQVKPAYPL